MVGLYVGDGHDTLIARGRGHEFQTFFNQDLGIDLLHFRFARTAVGEKIHRKVINFLQIAIDDSPTLGGLREISTSEAHLDDIRAAAKRLQNVLDRVGERGRCFTDGGQTLGL